MIKRSLTSELLAALNDTAVLFLAGARQTGKSTLVKHLNDSGYKARYISFDDYSFQMAAKADPAGFVSGLQSNVVIDEVQRVPEIFLAIKAVVDKKRVPGQFLLTGSANILTIPKIADSLAGRIEIQMLWPFSQCELRNGSGGLIDALFDGVELVDIVPVDENELWDTITVGGYPEVNSRTDQNRRNAWFRNYVLTLLQRDIKEIAHIDGLTLIPNLLNLLAARSSNLLNFADISRSIQIPQTSLKRYIALLESIFIINKVLPWSKNFNNKLVKTPKIHIHDTGLLSYLLGVNVNRLKDDRTLAGQFLETFVINEISKLCSWSKIKPQVNFFRTTAGKEVDIILEDASGKCVAIEVKSANHLNGKDVEGIKFFKEFMGEKFVRGIVLYTGNEIVPFQKDIHAVPVSVLWS
jgi:predicted AAA+ superfamily ATPase